MMNYAAALVSNWKEKMLRCHCSAQTTKSSRPSQRH